MAHAVIIVPVPMEIGSNKVAREVRPAPYKRNAPGREQRGGEPRSLAFSAPSDMTGPIKHFAFVGRRAHHPFRRQVQVGDETALGAPFDAGSAAQVFFGQSAKAPIWVNVFDPSMAIPGFVEFSRLRPTGDMPTHSPRWARSDVDLIEEAFGYLKRINPSLTDADRIDAAAGRLRFAQPVCPPGFLATIPRVQTPIAGLQVADTCFYYPEDRGVSESVRWGERIAAAIDNASIWQ